MEEGERVIKTRSNLLLVVCRGLDNINELARCLVSNTDNINSTIVMILLLCFDFIIVYYIFVVVLLVSHSKINLLKL